jgi:hypothetical protein
MVRWKEKIKHSKNENHKLKIDYAIRKYTKENQWIHQILIDNIPTLKEALNLEILCIFYFDTYKHGYNYTVGGGGHGKNSKKTNIKISKSLSGKKKSEEHKIHLSESKIGKPNNQLGLKRSKRFLKQNSELHSKNWKIVYPDFKMRIVNNLYKFCKIHKLNYDCMYKVSEGKHK